MRPRLLLAIVKFAACVALLTFVVLNPGAPNLAFAKAKDEPKWIEVHTAHFSVITDAGDKRGREVALRMEQMRSIFGQILLKDKLTMPAPITVIAFKSDQQYAWLLRRNRAWRAAFTCLGRCRFISS